MRLEFNFVAPSLNKLNSSFWKMYNLKKRFLRYLKNYELLGLKEPKKMKVIITVCNSRLLDYDNLVGGNKKLVDCLKQKKLIWDDRPEYLIVEYRQEKCKRGLERTIVEIENIAG